MREAIDFVRQQAAANDPSTEGKRGIDIVLRTTSLGRAGSARTVAGEHAASARRRVRDRG